MQTNDFPNDGVFSIKITKTFFLIFQNFRNNLNVLYPYSFTIE